MITQDWINKQIDILIRFLRKILNNDNIKYNFSIEEEMNDSDSYKTYIEIFDLVKRYKFNEAENILFDKINSTDINKEYLELAVDFYFKLNELSEDELEKGDFSREEIHEGLNDIISLYGINM